MNIIVFQMNIIAGEPARNREKVKAWFHRNVNHGVDIVMLPEMWTTAYALERLKDLAEPADGPSVTFLKELATDYDVHIIGGSIAVKEDDNIYNRAIVIDRKGRIVYEYDKIHLVPMLDEPKYLSGGRHKVQAFELDGIKMGIIICYDLRFPEIIRDLALQGIQVLFIPAEWPEARAAHWETLSTARAIENQMYVVSCNRIGSYNGTTFAGRSMFIEPFGGVLSKGTPDKEEVLQNTLDLESVKRVRKEVPIFKSRVPDLYK